MPPIIQPTEEFVKAEPQILAKKTQSQKEQPLRVIFLGTPEFSVPILEALIKSDYKPSAVITAPDKPTGRGQEITPPPVKIAAQQNDISVFQPETKQQLIDQALILKPDLIVVAAYGKILPKEVLGIPKYGAVNVHPSLLPKYRGCSPIQFPILNGDHETGVTIMLMNEKMDEGPILAQEIITIEEKETAKSLEEKLSLLGAKLLIKTLGQWLILKEMPDTAQKLIRPQEQDHSQASYTKILTKQDGKIIWDKTAQELERQIRAFHPWPGSFAYFKRQTQPKPSPFEKPPKVEKPLILKFLKAVILPLQTEKELGEVFLTDDKPPHQMSTFENSRKTQGSLWCGGKKLAVQTGKDCLIIEELQLEGRKPINSQDFLNGHPEIIGTILQ